jgi:hypothetical protein
LWLGILTLCPLESTLASELVNKIYCALALAIRRCSESGAAKRQISIYTPAPALLRSGETRHPFARDDSFTSSQMLEPGTHNPCDILPEPSPMIGLLFATS